MTVFVSVIIISPYFNSHAHVERDALCQLIAPCRQHFNSHAHVERDLLPVLVVIRTAISTHTLTWSVTVSFIPSTATFTISTHTLTWSVTARHRLHRCRHIHFNSHAHVERDFIKKLSDEITKISTHTLTWSVTIVHKLKITVENNFNSHAHVERDLY